MLEQFLKYGPFDSLKEEEKKEQEIKKREIFLRPKRGPEVGQFVYGCTTVGDINVAAKEMFSKGFDIVAR